MYYLSTADAELGKRLVEIIMPWLQATVDVYLLQNESAVTGRYKSLGDFPPSQANILMPVINLADAVLVGDAFTLEQRERIHAQMAFLGYVVNRPDYWSSERGFAGNPNMTTTVAALQTTIGCFLASHPLARTWAENGLKELKNELDRWSDFNGGWLEAPHYAMASYDYLLGCFLMARNSGFDDCVFDPKMKKVAEWFAKISTPLDARKGWRHLPPIGNTFLYEPSGEYSLVASIWKEKNPEFASQMQWMFEQQGSQPKPGIGGFFPTLAGYRTLLTDTNIVEKAPSYGSELFPDTGVILRNKFPCDRETQLHLIAGIYNHLHYDDDSGSITIWGKGRIVADDFGYTGLGPKEDHSMVETALATNGLTMHVGEFAPSPSFDYVRGVFGGWTRQIAFVKDADPLAPNYFVLCDTLQAAAPATWRLWLTCNKVTLASQKALVE